MIIPVELHIKEREVVRRFDCHLIVGGTIFLLRSLNTDCKLKAIIFGNFVDFCLEIGEPNDSSCPLD
jgi:hypothetical protein